MAYNITGLQEAVTIIDVVDVANTAVDGNLVGGFLIAFYFVMLLKVNSNDFYKFMLGSSFVFLGFSIFLRLAGLINEMYIFAFIIMMALSGLVVFMRR